MYFCTITYRTNDFYYSLDRTGVSLILDMDHVLRCSDPDLSYAFCLSSNVLESIYFATHS